MAVAMECTHGKAQISCDDFPSDWHPYSNVPYPFLFGFIYILPYLLLIAQLMLWNGKPSPWTHSLLPSAAIRHRQLRVAYLETAESCWQAVRSPPVLVIFTEIPVARVMVYVVLQSAGISLLKGLSLLQFIQTHTLVHYRSWSRVLELNFQGHNTVEWGRISDLHLQEDGESKSIWGSRLQLFGVMIWRLKRKDKYEGHFHWMCAHICIYEHTYWAASSLLYLNTAVKGKIFLIH